MSEYEGRRIAREDLVRVLCQDQVRRGASVPDVRAAERQAHERADRLDKKQDRNIKE